MKHIESWNVEPSAVVKSLLKPSAKKPSNSWEKSVPPSSHPHLTSPSLGMPSLRHARSTALFRAVHSSLPSLSCAFGAGCVACRSCTGAHGWRQARAQRAPFLSRFFKAVHDGHPGASWMAAASPILRWYAFPVVALSAVSKGFTGHGLPVRCHSACTYYRTFACVSRGSQTLSGLIVCKRR